MFAHAEKAADAEYDIFDLGRLVDDQLLDLADLLVVVVVHVDPDDFGSPPLSVLVDGRVDVGAVGGGVLGVGRTGQERSAQQRRGKIFRFHFSLQVVGCWLKPKCWNSAKVPLRKLVKGGT